MKSTSLKEIAMLLTVIFCMVSCSGDASKNDSGAFVTDSAGVDQGVALTRLGLLVDSYPALGDSDRAEIMERYGDVLRMLMEMSAEVDSLSDASLREYASGRVMSMFMPEIKSVFGAENDTLPFMFDKLESRLKSELPGVVMPHVYTVVSPYNQSVVFAGDSIMFLALNHYLGPSHRAYAGFADYVRRHKSPGRIGPDVAEAIVATRFPFEETGRSTVLSRLLYEGAVVEAVMRIAGVDEATALGYDSSEMRWAVENERDAWRALLTRRMLFSTDAETARRLVAPAPSTSVLNAESPGRLGRFIGHRILNRYLENSRQRSLAFLLSPEFYLDETSLRKSGYQN